MYLLTLDKVHDTNILKKIYNNMACFGLDKVTFVVYVPNLAEKSYKIKGLQYHAIKLDVTELALLEEDDIEDIILDMIELNTNVLLTNQVNVDEDKYELINNIVADFGLQCTILNPLDTKKKIDIKNLTFNDLQIIKEIFKVNTDIEGFDLHQFMLRYKIDNEGKMYDEKGTFVLDVNSENLYNMVFHKPRGIKKLISSEMQRYEKNSQFSTRFYEPWIFLNEDISSVGSQIRDYKYQVFEAVKNIHPNMYPELPIELVELLNVNSYIMFDDIIDILSENGEKEE